MKKLLFILSIAVSGVLMSFISAAPKNDAYQIDSSKSSIEWIGRKVVGSHHGTVKLSSGAVAVNSKGQPVSGNFVMDMKSITVEDLTNEEQNKRLVNHLLSDDFFSAEKNPTASFQITKISAAGSGKVNIEGKLTIKGITNSIKFPADYQTNGNTFSATAKGVKVNRTKYNIKYRSNSFFDSLGDKAIDNDFELNINLIASK